jgi:hypothetical protein
MSISTYKATLKAGLVTAFNSSNEGQYALTPAQEAVITNVTNVFGDALVAYIATLKLSLPVGLVAGPTPVTGTTAPGSIT